MSVKKLPVIAITADQREWLEVESGNTLDSIAGVVRKLIQDRIDKSKKGRTIK